MLRPPIRAVLFDIDGTLYWQPPLRLAMALEMAVCATGARARRDLRTVLAFRRVREELRHGDGRDEGLAERQYTAVAHQLACPPADVERAVNEWIYRRPLKWLQYVRRGGLVELLDWLRQRGVRCGVFSDYPAEDKLAAL